MPPIHSNNELGLKPCIWEKKCARYIKLIRLIADIMSQMENFEKRKFETTDFEYGSVSAD